MVILYLKVSMMPVQLLLKLLRFLLQLLFGALGVGCRLLLECSQLLLQFCVGNFQIVNLLFQSTGSMHQLV